jgi:hypothetical protein
VIKDCGSNPLRELDRARRRAHNHAKLASGIETDLKTIGQLPHLKNTMSNLPHHAESIVFTAMVDEKAASTSKRFIHFRHYS